MMRALFRLAPWMAAGPARVAVGLICAAVAVTVGLGTGQAFAQTYPNRPITLVVPFAPGASADGIGRLIGHELSVALGQPVVVDNKPGAGGALGMMAVARAAPDGYTIGLGATGAIAVNPHLPGAPPLKPERDLEPLGKLADIPLVFVVSASGGSRDLKSFLDAARRSPQPVAVANTGQNTAQHLSTELLATMAGVRLQPVPYRGSGPAVTDLLGGNVPAAMVDLTSAYPHVKAGKLLALGVTTLQRSKAAPEIPTIDQAGVKGYSAPAWMGLFLPAQTAPEASARLSLALRRVMASPGVQAQILKLAAEPAYMDGSAFGKFIEGESKKWADVISRLPANPKK